jgi:hypothetical protein
MGSRSVAGMLTLLRFIVSVLVRRFRRRAVLELENLALRRQLHVLRRQRPGLPRLFVIDRLLWVWLYRLWPRCLEVMVLVKPATVIQWHRQGFRRYWRWRSRSGRPSVTREVRKLIRQMSSANPLWGAPRIHGELLKLGIEISQATVAKHMVRRRGAPSPTWRTFLRNHAEGVAAIDVFVAPSASFRLLYVMIILAHDRRNILRTAVTEHPTAAWLSRQVTEAFPWDTAPRYLLRDRDGSYGAYFRNRVEAMGITEVITAARSPWQNAYVERVIWFDSPRVSRSHRAPSAPRPVLVCRLLPTHPHASFARQGLPRLTPDYAAQNRKGRRHPESRRLASSLRTSRRLTRTISCSPMLRGRRYASSEVSRSGFFDLDNGAEHLWFRSLPDSLLQFH